VKHDEGSITPLFSVVLALIAVTALGITEVAKHTRLSTSAHTAAEALALAAVLDSDLDDLARRYGVDSYAVSYDDMSITVHVIRDGYRADATAIDHRADTDSPD
jgi:hypothetical protein